MCRSLNRSQAAVRGIEADAKRIMFANQPMPTMPSKPVSQKRPEILHRIGPALHTSLCTKSSTTTCQLSFSNAIITPNSLLLKRCLPCHPPCGAGFDVSTQGLLKMETITIPSPSVFLSSPVVQSAKLSPPTHATPQKRKKTTTKQSSTASKPSAGVTKPKQSKSRNGEHSTPKSSDPPLYLAGSAS